MVVEYVHSYQCEESLLYAEITYMMYIREIATFSHSGYFSSFFLKMSLCIVTQFKPIANLSPKIAQ
jgi:hypothetical protein